MPAIKRLPQYCGLEVNKPVLFNPYQDGLLRSRRLRICPACYHIGPVDGRGIFTCERCHRYETSQVIAMKAFNHLGIVGGRRSGKSFVGAMAAREEMLVPNLLGWVCGPTFKVLHDATLPTLFKILPQNWIDDWDQQHMELRLVNGHVIQARSLDDPGRGIGMGPHWAWFDEPQKMKEKAWDTFQPSLTENRGNTIFTWTPNGFDWTWRRLWKTANEDHEPGFWMAKCKTLDNPSIDPAEIAFRRRTMPAKMFQQEYEAEFVSFAGNIYDWEQVEGLILRNDEAMRYFIPEWPRLSPQRTLVLGIFGGGTRPMAAVLMALTERGVVCVDEYLDERRSVLSHLDPMREKLLAVKDQTGRTVSFLPARWCASESASYVIAEYATRGVGIIPTASYLIDGVERTQSMLFMQQLWFGYTCPKLLDQLRMYRWADTSNEDTDESADPENERDFRKENELPRALHQGL